MESRPRIPLALLALAVVLAAACGGSGPVAASSPSTQPSVAFATGHFRVLTDRVDPSALHGVADALEANYARVTSDLRTGDVAVTDVYVWQDQSAYYADMQRYLGQVYAGSAGWVRGAHAISVLAGANTPLNAVHEFCHVATMAVNATIANNPRWLWETVALYESGQFVNPATLDYFRNGLFPTIADLDLDFSRSHQVYDVGYVLGEFVVSTWGMDGLLQLVRANGAIERALNLSIGAFEQRWYAWLRERYLH